MMSRGLKCSLILSVDFAISRSSFAWSSILSSTRFRSSSISFFLYFYWASQRSSSYFLVMSRAFS